MAELETNDLVANRFRVIRTLGRGGSAVTYEAEDTSNGALVAVKQLLLWEHREWKALELFQREAKVLAAIEHPQVPKLIEWLDVDENGSQAFYLVRELVPGSSLAELIERGERFDEAAVKHTLREMLGVLRDLHTLSPPIIHRDIKPSNVLRRDDGTLVLIDFGAVRKPSEADGSTIVGTYGYMAPEQFRGNAVAASDIYAVAATALFLITHRPPSELPQQGLGIDLSSVVAPPDLLAWLRRALAPDPDARFVSARAALTALDAPTPAAVIRPAAPPSKRGRTMALAATLAVVVVGGAVGVTLLEAQEPEHMVQTAGTAEPVREHARWVNSASTLRNIGAGAFGIAFLPDGQFITASSHGLVQVWDIESAKPVRTVKGHPGGRLYGFDATPDGRWAAAAGGARTVLIDLANGDKARELQTHGGAVFQIRFSHDGELVATGGADGVVFVQRTSDGSLVQKIEPKAGEVHSLMFLRDAERIAIGTRSGALQLWSLSTGKLALQLPGHKAAVNQIILGKDDGTIISAGDDRAVDVWELDWKRSAKHFGSHYGEVWAVAMSPDGHRLISAGEADTIWVVDLANGEVLEQRSARLGGVVELAVSPDGKFFAASGFNEWVHIWPMPGAAWLPPIPPEGYELVAEVKPDASSPVARLVREAEDLLDAWPKERDALTRAEQLLDRATNMDATFAPIYVERARLAFKGGFLSAKKYQPGSLEKAHAELDRALELDATLTLAVITKAYVYTFEGNLGSARKAAERAVELAPNDARAHLVALEVAAEQERVDDAIREAKLVISLTEASRLRYAVCQAMQDVYAHRNDEDSKEQMYIAMMRYNPTSAWTRGNYAQFLVNRGRHEEAIVLATEALAIMNYGNGRRTLAEAYAQRAVAQATNDEIEEAKRTIALAEATWSSPNAEVEVAKGAYDFALGRLDGDQQHVEDAMKHFNEALKIDPKHRQAKRWVNYYRGMVNKVAEVAR